MEKNIIVGITGASGSIYGIRMVEQLLKKNYNIYLIITKYGVKVIEYELEEKIDFILERLNSINKGKLIYCDNEDFFLSPASGSFESEGMIIAPCSVGTLAKISHGIGESLLTRSADVVIKENRKLTLLVRETPFSSIHLENMLKLSRMGVTIFPPSPAFYDKPKTIDNIVDITVGRVLKSMGITNDLFKQWAVEDGISDD